MMDEKTYGTTYNGILCSHKENEMVKFAEKWMDLEKYIKAQKDKCCMFFLVCTYYFLFLYMYMHLR